MSTLLKAYLMETDNPFLMFKCFYEDINENLKKATEYKGILKVYGPANPAHTFFQDALKDKGDDELREAYDAMVEMREQMKDKKTGIGKDIFSIKFRLPKGTTKDDPFPKSPYSKYQRGNNLFSLKRQLEQIKKVVNENKNINPAAVKRLTAAIDVWLENIPKMMPELKPKITDKEIEEIQGRGSDDPRIRGESKHAFQEALGIKKPMKMTSDAGVWLKKIKTYEKNISTFLGGDERSKKRIMERFFKVGKIDELEDIAEEVLVLSDTIRDTDNVKKKFAKLRRNLRQKRPKGTIVEQLDVAYKELHKVSRLSKDKRKEKEGHFRNIKRKLPKGETKRTITHSLGPRKEYIARRMEQMETDFQFHLKRLKGKDKEKLLKKKKYAAEKYEEDIGAFYDKESKRLSQKDTRFGGRNAYATARIEEEKERQEKKESEDFMSRLLAGETWTSEGFGEEE